MLTFFLELGHLARDHQITLYMVLIVLVWGVWGLKAYFSSKYKPFTGTFTGTVSVIIPVVDEPAELFRDVLTRIVKQLRRTEIVVVINGAENPELAAVCSEFGVVTVHTPVRGKRNALKVGLEHTSGDIAVLVDSDTQWEENTLVELLRPFESATVGGVTTSQRILEPNRNALTRWADWMESIRSEYSLPAMSYNGAVGCLPGRTIAFRREIIVNNMDRFLNEKFLGVFLEVSDDRTLTNFALQDGFKTVFQSTAVVYTDAPTDLRTLVKQQKRWARGSQYNTLRMLGWMLRNSPILAIYYLADIVIPFIVVGCLAGWALAVAWPTDIDLYSDFVVKPTGVGILVLFVLAVSLTSAGVVIRYSRHFSTRLRDIKWVPVFMVLNTFLLIPIRVHGFFVCALNSGWGTRAGAFGGTKTRNAKVLIPGVLGVLLLSAVLAAVVLPGRGIFA